MITAKAAKHELCDRSSKAGGTDNLRLVSVSTFSANHYSAELRGAVREKDAVEEKGIRFSSPSKCNSSSTCSLVMLPADPLSPANFSNSITILITFLSNVHHSLSHSKYSF